MDRSLFVTTQLKARSISAIRNRDGAKFPANDFVRGVIAAQCSALQRLGVTAALQIVGGPTVVESGSSVTVDVSIQITGDVAQDHIQTIISELVEGIQRGEVLDVRQLAKHGFTGVGAEVVPSTAEA